MGEKHKHAEVIHAYADGAAIQMLTANGAWITPAFPDFDPEREYRIKPEPPKYPQTKMTDGQLKRAFHAANGETQKGWRGIANAAIARAIEDGDVVPEAMLEKVASFALEGGRESVIYRDEKKPNGIPYESVILGVNLQEIIEKAKGGA